MSVLDDVRAVVAEHADVADDDAPLAIDSLTLVTLIEALEDRFDVRVAARDVLPAHFASVSAIAEYVARCRERRA
jgi:acyl carrier protein